MTMIIIYVIVCNSCFFLNQQFITQHAVANHGSYFVTTYRRYKQHVEEETEERKRKKEEKKKN